MKLKRYYGSYESKIGMIYVVVDDQQIKSVHIGEEDFRKHEERTLPLYSPDHPLIKRAITQLGEYFHGKRKTFDLPTLVEGTAFQKSVWAMLNEIPYGVTKSYQEVAEAIGNKKAVRAIGQANKANPLPIIIPCHRVIGKNKSLTGYAGTRIDIKEVLLTLEGSL